MANLCRCLRATLVGESRGASGEGSDDATALRQWLRKEVRAAACELTSATICRQHEIVEELKDRQEEQRGTLERLGICLAQHAGTIDGQERRLEELRGGLAQFLQATVDELGESVAPHAIAINQHYSATAERDGGLKHHNAGIDRHRRTMICESEGTRVQHGTTIDQHQMTMQKLEGSLAEHSPIILQDNKKIAFDCQWWLQWTHGQLQAIKPSPEIHHTMSAPKVAPASHVLAAPNDASNTSAELRPDDALRRQRSAWAKAQSAEPGTLARRIVAASSARETRGKGAATVAAAASEYVDEDVDEDASTPACFPADAELQHANGSRVLVQHVRVGMVLRASSGSETVVKRVRGFLGPYGRRTLRLMTRGGAQTRVMLRQRLAVPHEGPRREARRLRAGDAVVLSDGTEDELVAAEPCEDVEDVYEICVCSDPPNAVFCLPAPLTMISSHA